MKMRGQESQGRLARCATGLSVAVAGNGELLDIKKKKGKCERT